jgi:hypothetical protein
MIDHLQHDIAHLLQTPPPLQKYEKTKCDKNILELNEPSTREHT